MTFRLRGQTVTLVTIRLRNGVRMVLLKRKPRVNLTPRKGSLRAMMKDKILVISITQSAL